MIKLLSSTLLFLLMSGCATYNIKSANIEKNKPLPAGHGVVAVQITNNTDRLGDLHKSWSQVYVVRLDNMEELKQAAIAKAKTKKKSVNEEKVDWSPEIYTLTPKSKGVIDSQIFIGSMPQGRYAISRLHSYYNDGNMSAWINMPVWDSAGEFTVLPTELTNLGSLVFQPLLNVKNKSFWSSGSSQKAYVTRVKDLDQLDNLLTVHYPDISSKLNLGKVNGWNDDGYKSHRENLSLLSRSNAYGNKSIALQKNATGAVAARFGQLKVLDKNLEWSQINLPSNAQISSILEYEEGVIIASEFGTIFSAKDFKSQWLKSNPVSAKEAITWLGKGHQSNFAVTSSDMQYLIYQFNNVNEPWKKIGSYKKKHASGFFVQNGGLFPIITKEGSIRIFNDNKIYDYNFGTSSWSERKGTALVKLAQARNAALLALEVSQWDGIGDQIVSYDDGVSWKTINRSLGWFGDNKTDQSLPAILDDGTVVSVGRVRKNKNSKSRLKIITNKKDSLSNSKSWISHGDAKEDCYTMLPELTYKGILYFLCDKGDLVSTADLGDSWNEEIGINIAAMQKEFESMLKLISESKESK